MPSIHIPRPTRLVGQRSTCARQPDRRDAQHRRTRTPEDLAGNRRCRQGRRRFDTRRRGHASWQRRPIRARTSGRLRGQPLGGPLSGSRSRPALRRKTSRPRRPTQEQVHRRAANLQRLRNRVAHHEPIFKRHQGAGHGQHRGRYWSYATRPSSSSAGCARSSRRFTAPNDALRLSSQSVLGWPPNGDDHLSAFLCPKTVSEEPDVQQDSAMNAPVADSSRPRVREVPGQNFVRARICVCRSSSPT